MCKVCDAARATSAAPTYFPVADIGGRFFADGGLEHNNSSFAVYFHYTSDERKKSTKANLSAPPHFSPHGDLDCSYVRFTNIGTGAGDRLASLAPGTIRRVVFLKQNLTEIDVNSEEKVKIMRQFESLKPEVFKYERFEANHGVSNIKLDHHDALGEIRQKTELYLNEQDTKKLPKDVGRMIANDYLEFHSAHEQDNASASSVLNHLSRRHLNVPGLLPASSSTSAAKCGHSDPPDPEVHVEFPSNENAANNSPPTLTEYTTDTFFLPDQHQHYAHDDSSVDIIESGNPMPPALA